MENKIQHEIDFSELYHHENNPGSQAHFEENKSKFSNQCKIVYEAFLRGERLTTTKALLNYGIGDLRRRVKDLKDMWKVPVQSEMIGKNYKEYFLNIN
jgi:hypothetical protein